MSLLRQAFPGQGKNEPVFIFLRRYYIAFLPVVLIGLVMIGVSIAIFAAAYYSLSSRGEAASDSYGLYNWLVMIGGTFGLFTVIFIAVAWLDFYFDINIVTNRRVVDVNQNGLFSREISELSLEDVEDVSVHYQGVLPTFFNYGEIIIQTAGTQSNFMFHNIRNPRDVASIIVDLSEQAKRGIVQDSRFPETSVVGVINDKLISTKQGLVDLGAMSHE